MSALVDYIRSAWHEVPDGVTIPEDVEFAAVWNRQGVVTHVGAGEPGERLRMADHAADIARFTPEPLPVESDFELPTEPGHYTDKDGGLWGLNGGRWYTLGVKHSFRASEMSVFAPFTPVTLVPNGIGVMDETDKRDRVDANGDRWTWDGGTATWGYLGAERRYGTIAAFADDYGPLRFADEETDHE